MTMRGCNSSSSGAHILVFPFPSQGHMIPLLDLTHQLASRGLTITILITPKNLPFLKPFLAKHPSSIHTLVLPFPSGHPKLPFGAENGKDMPNDCFPALMRSLGQLYQPLLGWFNSHPSPPTAIVSDMFLGWTHQLACRLGIPRFVFSPSGALALSVIVSLWRNMPEQPKTGQDEVVSFPEIPNCPKYPWWQLSPLYRRYVEGDPDSEFMKDGFRANLVSWGLVVNSFAELEGVYLEHLKKEMGHDRVWAVGPVLPLNNGDQSGPTERGGSSSLSVQDIASWLDACGGDDDGKDHRTVVYVCFGSQAVLTNAQMEELAFGLEKSGVHFIWCVKEPTGGHVDGQYGAIPSGFEDRVAERGLVIRGWAPQAWILRHRAVAAFLTHCGWNSAVEALVAGVPLLAWPMGADQFSNATLLVDELKVGVRACEGAKTVPDSAELARALADSVSENRVERKRAKDLSKAARDALRDGGSSATNLNDLVKHLCELELEKHKDEAM